MQMFPVSVKEIQEGSLNLERAAAGTEGDRFEPRERGFSAPESLT